MCCFLEVYDLSFFFHFGTVELVHNLSGPLNHRFSYARAPDPYFEIWVWKASILVRVLVSSSNTFSWRRRNKVREGIHAGETHCGGAAAGRSVSRSASRPPAATHLHCHSEVVPVFNFRDLQLQPHGHLQHKRTSKIDLIWGRKTEIN